MHAGDIDTKYGKGESLVMDNPKVSAIIPVYNVEKYLEKCLDSIINQTLKEIEIICIDDGSTDNSISILNKLAQKDNRIKIILQENQGPSAARNAGIDIANGEYLVFIDSDDWMEFDAFEKLVDDLEKTNADFVACGTNVIYEKPDPILAPNDAYYLRIIKRGLRPVSENIFTSLNVSCCNKMHRKSIIDKYNLRYKNGLFNEDALFFWQYLSLSKTIYFEPEKLYNYLRRNGSIMTKTFNKSFGKRVLDHLKVGELFYEHLQRHNLFKKYNAVFWRCYDQCCQYSLQYSDENTKFEARKMIHEFLKNKKIPKNEKLINFQKNPDCGEYYITKYLLFGSLPIFTIRENPKNRKFYLFDVIPLLNIQGVIHG